MFTSANFSRFEIENPEPIVTENNVRKQELHISIRTELNKDKESLPQKRIV